MACKLCDRKKNVKTSTPGSQQKPLKKSARACAAVRNSKYRPVQRGYYTEVLHAKAQALIYTAHINCAQQNGSLAWQLSCAWRSPSANFSGSPGWVQLLQLAVDDHPA